ncbi:MAG: glycosyltransferase family 4 protein [Chloroflexi bacterium]|nr:glycosyltransferase family 4 protein [Chloroflexota bacterium]
MRILYLIGAYGPHLLGNDVHEETCDYLEQHGHTVDVFTPGAGFADEQEAPDSARSGRRVYRILPAGGLRTKLARALSLRFLKYDRFLDLLAGYSRFLAQHTGKYDLVHVEAAYPFGAIAALASLHASIPFVLNLQGADVMSCPEVDYGYARFAIPRWLTSFAMWRAKAVRANSYRTEKLAVALGAGKDKTETIPRNVRERAYLPDNVSLEEYRSQSRALLLPHWGVADDAQVLIALSRLHPFKGIEYLVRAMPAVLERSPRAVFLVCGPSRITPRYGDYVTYLRKLADTLGMSGHIVFTGAVDYDDVRSYMAASDVLVVPSVVEALNKVVVEAAAVGTPSVVTSSTGIADFVSQYRCGLVVGPRSAEELAAGIVRLLEDEGLRRETSMRCTSFAEGFRTGPITERLMRLYER